MQGPKDTTVREDSLNHSDQFRQIAGSICHRVKNDFQTIANLISMAASGADSPQGLSAAMDGRIAALSAPYTAIANLGAPPLLDQLAQEVGKLVLRQKGLALRILYDLPPLDLGLRICSPLALWLFETINNAVCHGKPNQGNIKVEVKGGLDETNFWIVVSDGGPGLPSSIDLNDPQTLGLGLMLAQGVTSCDLRGHLECENLSPGLKISLIIPASEFNRLNQGQWK
ncbi:MAG: sensor histidine kinase [Desulfarculaceae bacterium]|jgi:two-component sensor histidine kinase